MRRPGENRGWLRTVAWQLSLLFLFIASAEAAHYHWLGLSANSAVECAGVAEGPCLICLAAHSAAAPAPVLAYDSPPLAHVAKLVCPSMPAASQPAIFGDYVRPPPQV